MILALAVATFRECFRRPFPYLCVAAIALLALASRALLAFSFGQGPQESQSLAIAAVFLAGLMGAAFVGSGLVRRDVERGTLAVVLSTRSSIATYLTGRYVGLLAATAAMSGLVALAMGVLLWAMPPRDPGRVLTGTLFAACGRAMLLIAVLDAAAIAASATMSRLVAPIALLGFLLTSSLVATGALSVILPDLSLFALDSVRPAPILPLVGYAFVFSCAFISAAFIVLSLRRPMREQA